VVWNSVPFTKMLPKPLMAPVAITALIPVDEGELMLEEPPPPHATAKPAIAATTRNTLIFNITSPIAVGAAVTSCWRHAQKRYIPNASGCPRASGTSFVNGIDSKKTGHLGSAMPPWRQR